jgi:RNA polymerase sigma-70 factor (ECF subfamily)
VPEKKYSEIYMLSASREESLIEELIEGCRNNELNCQEMLYKHFFGYALTIGIRYLGDYSEAIEIVDDSFMKVFEKIKTYDKNKNFKQWLRKIIINTAIDRIRKKQIKNVKERKVNGEDIVHKSTDEPDSTLQTNEILKLLKRLPYLHGTVFNLYEIEGFNHKEIAEMLNIPESSSRTYLTRAKKELRELYQKYFQ